MSVIAFLGQTRDPSAGTPQRTSSSRTTTTSNTYNQIPYVKLYLELIIFDCLSAYWVFQATLVE